MVSSLDHLVLAVADLDGATAVYDRVLGRAPSWRGRHPAMGTRNTLYRLDNTYLELLAAEAAPAPLGESVRASLRGREEQPFAIALGVADVDAAVRTARARGLSIGDAADGAGTDDGSGVRRTWRSAFFAGSSTRGLRLFLIQHTSPAALLPPATKRADATVDGIDHVVVVTQDLDASLALWRDGLGVREAWRRDFPERGTRNLGLDLGGIIVELLQRTDRAPSERPDVFWGVAHRTADCDTLAARLRADGLPVDDPRPGLMASTRVATLRWERTKTLLIAAEESG